MPQQVFERRTATALWEFELFPFNLMVELTPENGFVQVRVWTRSCFSEMEEVTLSLPEPSLPSRNPECCHAPAATDFRTYRWKVWILIGTLAICLSGFEFLVTWPGRLQAASADGLFADFPDQVARWAWRSGIAELAALWWIVAFSATVGSFINVVVYRMPLGKSLGGAGSACVSCQTPIKWYDNVPVLGWLLLGGRCRKCNAKIAIRYPIVEATAIALGLGLFILTVQTRVSLLFDPAAKSLWYYWLVERPPAQGILTFFYLLPVQMACLAIAWVDVDRARLPRRFYVSVATMVVAAALAYTIFLGPRLAIFFHSHTWAQVSLIPTNMQWMTHLWSSHVGPALGEANGQSLRVFELLVAQAGGGVFGIGIGCLAWRIGSAIGLAHLVASESELARHLDFRSTIANFALIGLVGGWFLAVFVFLLWVVELSVRFIGTGHVRQTPVGGATVWFGLPYYFLIAAAIWW